MAMINCPECGKEISNKAQKCIHCGKVFVKEEEVKEEIKCKECGAVLSEEDTVCSNCGFPVEPQDEIVKSVPQSVELSGVKMKSKTKKIIIGAVVAVIAIVIGSIFFKVISDNNAEKNYIASYNQYIDDAEAIRTLMLDGGSDAESLANLTSKVWRQCIYKKDADSTTTKYVIQSSYQSNQYFSSYMYVDDFNKGLNNLYEDSTTKTKVSQIESNQETVKGQMKSMQNVPEGLSDLKNGISDLYDIYTTFTNMAIDPSGSYSDFSSSLNKLDTEFMASYKKLDTLTPDKK